MILINYSHPLTPAQIGQVQRLAGQEITRSVQVPVQFESSLSFLPQLEALMREIPLSSEELQGEALLVNLPALNFIAALLLAELHGRMGYFPPVLRLAPLEGCLPPRYEVAEILNLQAVRDQARRGRFNGRGEA